MDGTVLTRIAVSTHSRAEAPEVVRRTFPQLQLRVEETAGPFVLRHSVSGNERLQTSELMVSGAARADGALPEGLIAAGFVLSGRLTLEYPRHRIDTGRPYLRPSGNAVMRMADAHLRLITFDSTAFRRTAERYSEVLGGHYRLNRTSPTSAESATAWRWVADRIHDSLRDEAALGNPTIAAELFDLGVRMLLTTFGDPADRARHQEELSVSPSAVRRAVAYLEEHAAGSVTMPEVAAAARVSLRSLQSQFRRHLGVSPLEHLHHIRLEAARRELLAMAAEGVSVQDVAVRWGFGNSGRFAKLYFDRFHELPSDTLRGRH